MKVKKERNAKTLQEYAKKYESDCENSLFIHFGKIKVDQIKYFKLITGQIKFKYRDVGENSTCDQS